MAFSQSSRTAINTLFSSGIALLAFGSVYRPEVLGFLAASPGIILLLVATAFAANGYRDHPITLRTWITMVAGFASSCIALLILGWNPVFASKIAPLFLLSLAWFSPLLCLPALELRAVRRGLIAGLGILALGYLLGDLFPNSIPQSIRQYIFGGGYEVYDSNRPRGFMTETSHFALLIGRFGVLLILVLEIGREVNLTRFVTRIFCLLPFLLLTNSKGMAIALAGTLIIFVLSRKTIIYGIFLIPIVWHIAEWQAELIAIDIENFTSTSTRLTLWLAALTSLTINPLGWGYYGFYGALETYAAASMNFLSDFPLIFIEVEYMLSERANYSFKSTLLDFSVLYGVPFLLLLWVTLKRLDLSDLRTRFTCIFLFLTTISTAGHESISFFLGLSTLLMFTEAQNRIYSSNYQGHAEGRRLLKRVKK